MSHPMIHDEVLEKALAKLKERLTALYPVARLIPFGSAARGEMDEESDVDVLVLTSKPLDMKSQDAIVHEVFEINLRHDTNISVLIIDVQNWVTKEEVRHEKEGKNGSSTYPALPGVWF